MLGAWQVPGGSAGDTPGGSAGQFGLGNPGYRLYMAASLSDANGMALAASGCTAGGTGRSTSWRRPGKARP
jgi:hypothetical protein